jgi:hypothetical protein
VPPDEREAVESLLREKISKDDGERIASVERMRDQTSF